MVGSSILSAKARSPCIERPETVCPHRGCKLRTGLDALFIGESTNLFRCCAVASPPKPARRIGARPQRPLGFVLSAIKVARIGALHLETDSQPFVLSPIKIASGRSAQIERAIADFKLHLPQSPVNL